MKRFGGLRKLRRGLLVGLGALLGGCPAPAPSNEPAVHTLPTPRISGTPDTRDGFLAELDPSAPAGVRVEYRVAGADGLEGSMEILRRAGGYRRTWWSLRGPDGSVIEGRIGTTPDERWAQAEDGDVVELESRVLGPLADAYLGRSSSDRERIVRELRAYRELGALARARHPGTSETIVGQACLSTRVVDHRVCSWEGPGIPLAFDGSAFSVEAVHVEIDPALSPSAFAPPPPTEEVGILAPVDLDAMLDALSEGDFGLLSSILEDDTGAPLPGA